MANSIVKPINTKAIEKATGASWKEWCAFLDDAETADMDHNAIVKKARAFKPISGWWAQSVAAAYEQYIGRRKPGQSSDGLFSASISRTLVMAQQPAFESWCTFAANLSKIDKQSIAGPPTTSTTPKRSYWRCKFKDGSNASICFEMKSAEKSVARIEHNRLGKELAIAEKKNAWASEKPPKCWR
ncbi:MAG: hypothetical protein ACR2Q4_06875 [Geminicoccaceae bacterium]